MARPDPAGRKDYQTNLEAAFTQSLGISALLIRNMQNEVAQIFTIDYVDFARSKGLAPMRVRVVTGRSSG